MLCYRLLTTTLPSMTTSRTRLSQFSGWLLVTVRSASFPGARDPTVGHPGQLRSPDGDAGQRALRIHPAPDRHGGAQREVLDGSLRMVGADSRFDAVALEDGGGLQGLVG